MIGLALAVSSCVIDRYIEGREIRNLSEQEKLTKRKEVDLLLKNEGSKKACQAIEDSLQSSTNVEMLRRMGDCYASGIHIKGEELAIGLNVPKNFSYRQLPNRNLRNAVKYYQASAACGDFEAKAALKKFNIPEALEASRAGCDKITVYYFSNRERDNRAFLMLPVLLPLAVVASPFVVPVHLLSNDLNKELELPPFPQVGPSVTLKREKAGPRWIVGNRHLDKNALSFETVPGYVEVRYYANPSSLDICGVIKLGSSCISDFELPECILSFDALPNHTYLLRSNKVGVWSLDMGPYERRKAHCIIQDEKTGQIITEHMT